MVIPILTYSSELWGFYTYECIEKVQNNFCKYVLKVPLHTTNVAVREQCCRYCIIALLLVKMIKYWCKLLCVDDQRVPKACYKMLYRLDDVGRKKWATDVKLNGC